MSLRRPPTAVTLLVLLLQVVFAVFGSGLVLCQEAEGESSFEWSGADCCTPQTARVAPGSTPQASGHGQGDCSGCEDSVLDQWQQRAERSGPPLSLPYPCLLAALPELPCPQRRPSLRTRIRSPGEAPLGFLRTIIIRC